MTPVRLAIALVALSAVVSSEDTCDEPSDYSPLTKAQSLRAPVAQDIINAAFEGDQFWEEHEALLQSAWREWETLNTELEEQVDVLEPALSMALEYASQQPSREAESVVKRLWTGDRDELPKGVYSAQVFSKGGVAYIRGLLDAATSAGVPLRRPNAMNRHGLILDPDVPGALPISPLIRLIEDALVKRVVRPVGRMMFPDRIGCGDDVDYFAFTIRYDGNEPQSGTHQHVSPKDTELKEHSDASVVTININLNLPNETDYAGSQVFFRPFSEQDSEVGEKSRFDVVSFSPGMGLIHLGSHRHGSLPTTSGSRYNLVIWLFGAHGDVRIAPYEENERLSLVQRWKGCKGLEIDKIFN